MAALAGRPGRNVNAAVGERARTFTVRRARRVASYGGVRADHGGVRSARDGDGADRWWIAQLRLGWAFCRRSLQAEFRNLCTQRTRNLLTIERKSRADLLVLLRRQKPWSKRNSMSSLASGATKAPLHPLRLIKHGTRFFIYSTTLLKPKHDEPFDPPYMLLKEKLQTLRDAGLAMQDAWPIIAKDTRENENTEPDVLLASITNEDRDPTWSYVIGALVRTEIQVAYYGQSPVGGPAMQRFRALLFEPPIHRAPDLTFTQVLESVVTSISEQKAKHAEKLKKIGKDIRDGIEYHQKKKHTQGTASRHSVATCGPRCSSPSHLIRDLQEIARSCPRPRVGRCRSACG